MLCKRVLVILSVLCCLGMISGCQLMNQGRKTVEYAVEDGVVRSVEEEDGVEVVLEEDEATALATLQNNIGRPLDSGMLQLMEVDGMMQLCDQNGIRIQLRGMSTHGLQWFPEIINNNAFRALSEDWRSNVIRLAMYVEESGYNYKPEVKDLLIEGIDLAIANDLYVIVDWHVHNPGNPGDPVYDKAMDFFEEISDLYPNDAHIIYELCNEPNSNAGGVSNDAAGWSEVKAYAEPIIKMLRDKGNENLVVVGTPNWSQRPDLAAENPIDDKNTAYTVHFYSGSHVSSSSNDDRSNVMSNARKAIDEGVAVFCSEWGTTKANGNDGLYLDEADVWIDFMNAKNISWVNWSLTNKDEDSGAFIPYELGVSVGTELDPGEDGKWKVYHLSESGEYVRSKIRGDIYDPIVRETLAVKTASATLGDLTFPSTFDDGTRNGWTWAVETGVRSDMMVEQVAGSMALCFDVTYPDQKPEDDWASAPRLILGDIKTTRSTHSHLMLDLYLEPERASAGNLAVYLAFAPPELGYWAQPNKTFPIDLANIDTLKSNEGDIYHVEVSFDLEDLMDGKVIGAETLLRDITLVVADEGSDYSGKMYIDNIRFE